jgi:hypothetical protein
MRPSNKTNLAALCVVLAMAPAALAQAPTWSFSGYGTLGVARSDNDQADYLVDAFKPSGPGHSREWDVKADSRIAGQVTAALTPTVTAVAQVIVQQRWDDKWTPTVEWANVRWQATEDLSIRAGRVVLPVFMVTDSRRVGYANPWVRPPVEVYSLVPVTNNDGVDASWRLPLTESSFTFSVTAGRSESKFPNSSGFDAGSAEARRLWSVITTYERGPFTARVNYGQARLTIAAFEPYFDAFRQFGPIGEAIAARYSVKDRKVDFLGLGASFDPGKWFATGEYARFDTHSIVGEREAWYASAGVRAGRWTPYATYARLKTLSNRSDPGLPVQFLPPEVQPVAAQLNGALNAQLALGPMQDTISVGVRWDFARNAALKLQYDRIDLGEGSVGTFGRVQPGFEPGGRVGVFSAAVDFVF